MTILPAQQHALVEAVSKALVQLPTEFLEVLPFDLFAHPGTSAPEPEPPCIARLLPLEEIEKALLRHVHSFDLPALAQQTAQQILDKARGRI